MVLHCFGKCVLKKSNVQLLSLPLLVNSKKMQKAGSNGLAKGLNDKTLETILTYLKGHSSQKHTCETLSKVSNLSKVTVPVT